MNRCTTNNRLNSVDCPDIYTPEFSHCLKKLLVQQPKSKRERIVSFIESGCDVVVSNRVVVSGLGISLSLVLVFAGSLYQSGSDFAPSQVQAQDIVQEMELASTHLDASQRALLEQQMNMTFDEIILQAKASNTRLVFDLDPRIPMNIIDTTQKHKQSRLISFHQNLNGQLQAKSLLPRYKSTEGTSSAFNKRRILQYLNQDASIVMLELSDTNTPRSGIILAGN